jgi:thiol-disulfide isomerase/thioredoxin
MLYLRDAHYFVDDKRRLCNTIKGFSFVFFYSNKCEYCHLVDPGFNMLAKKIQGCNFGKLNVDQDGQSIRIKAAKSSTPINYVPYLVFYFNGIPYNICSYDSDKSQHDNALLMENFLKKNIQEIAQQGSASELASKIPKYSIGMPKNTKGVCYYGYNAAYSSK